MKLRKIDKDQYLQLRSIGIPATYTHPHWNEGIEYLKKELSGDAWKDFDLSVAIGNGFRIEQIVFYTGVDDELEDDSED